MNRNTEETAVNDPKLPGTEELEAELNRAKYWHRFRKALKSTVYGLITVAAAAVLVATLLLPVLQIYGTSMTPSLHEGDIVLTLKGTSFSTGDVVAFYFNNKILVKRVIAGPGDWVDIKDDGTVFVNDEPLDEPYLEEKALGECDLSLPYQVPENRYFVMGDHRATSADSRVKEIGCVAEEQVVGRIMFNLWPLERFGEVR